MLLLVQAIKEQIDQKKQKFERRNQATVALIVILLVSLIPANFPQSHELRYFMFWMIVLVSLNLYLVFSKLVSHKNWFDSKYLKLAYLLFFIVMCAKMELSYLTPNFRTLQVRLDRVIDTRTLSQISPGRKNCIISKHGLNLANAVSVRDVFYYNSYFHPEIQPEYSIKVADDIEQCGSLNIVFRKK